MFTKGQQVNLVKTWNGKGTFSITSAIVHSCGKKQMVLNHATTGECLGRHFKPMREGWAGEFVLTVDESAETIALEAAKAEREKFIAYETGMINGAQGSNEYWAKRQRVLDEVIASEATVIRR